jgi:hypothetical protein
MSAATQRMNRKWDKYLVIAHIRRLPEVHYAYVREHDESLYKAAKKFFGDWETAVKESGREYVRLRSKDGETKT